MPSTAESVDQLPRLSQRSPDSNKGDFGRVLVVAGSRGMSGAAVLCGSAALRGGAGLVKVASPAEIQPTIAAGNACYTTEALPQDADGRLSQTALPALCRVAQAHDVVALGPGLGRSQGLNNLLADFVRQCEVPLVLDADGLNAFAEQGAAPSLALGAGEAFKHLALGAGKSLKSHAGPIVITPHPGEFARLLHMEVPEVQGRRQELAMRFAG